MLQLENAAMHKELEAVGPEFFEELEDLKHDHYQLKQEHMALLAQQP